MRIGILYICTGKYDIFWKDFYISCERFFFANNTTITKEYYVFTDAESLFMEENNPHIHKIYQKNLGWPDNTLKRFHMFLRIKDQLIKDTDFLYFFNANLLFMQPIGPEILPETTSNGLVGAQHPGFYNKPKNEYTYERSKKSTAYIPFDQGTCYYQGALSGGRTIEYLELCEHIKNQTDIDSQHDIIAVWHDESHINRYFIDHPPKTLSPAYLYPEGWDLPFEKIILIRDKNKKEYGGHRFLRKKDSWFSRLIKKIR